MINFQEIEDLIIKNLQGVPIIEPEKHREVEFALLNAIKFLNDNCLVALHKGTLVIGDPFTSDSRHLINIPNLGTTNYAVFGSLKGRNLDWNNNNDIFWTWGEPSNNSFYLYIREVSSTVQDVEFNYFILPRTP